MAEENVVNEISIANLADDIQYLEEVSKYMWEEWSKEYGTKLEDVIYRSKHSICKDRVPQMYIAKLNNELVGVVSIWNNDLISRQDLSPWLAALYIKKHYRGKGIGTLLQEKCIQVVKELGYKSLYLITDHENYYERSGWKFLEMAPLKGDNYTRVYEYEIM